MDGVAGRAVDYRDTGVALVRDVHGVVDRVGDRCHRAVTDRHRGWGLPAPGRHRGVACSSVDDRHCVDPGVGDVHGIGLLVDGDSARLVVGGIAADGDGRPRPRAAREIIGVAAPCVDDRDRVAESVGAAVVVAVGDVDGVRRRIDRDRARARARGCEAGKRRPEPRRPGGWRTRRRVGRRARQQAGGHRDEDPDHPPVLNVAGRSCPTTVPAHICLL